MQVVPTLGLSVKNVSYHSRRLQRLVATLSPRSADDFAALRERLSMMLWRTVHATLPPPTPSHPGGDTEAVNPDAKVPPPMLPIRIKSLAQIARLYDLRAQTPTALIPTHDARPLDHARRQPPPPRDRKTARPPHPLPPQARRQLDDRDPPGSPRLQGSPPIAPRPPRQHQHHSTPWYPLPHPQPRTENREPRTENREQNKKQKNKKINHLQNHPKIPIPYP